MKSKLEIYALCVCFASVISLVISMGIGSYALVEIGAPSLTMSSYQYDQYQSNEEYWKFRKPHCKENCEKVETPNEEELTKKREQAYEIAKSSESRGGFQSLIRCIFFIVFSLITFGIHWKIAKKCRAE